MSPTQDGTSGEPDSSFGYGLVYNPMDPYNMYPHYETGEEKYGPPPPFGINPQDPFNMKPFNPNAFGGLFGAPATVAPTPATGVMNTVGPNPFTPLLQPMTPATPMASPSNMAPPMVAPMGGMNPLLMAATVSALGKDSSFTPGAAPSSSFNTGAADPSSSFDASASGDAPSSSYHYMNALYPYYSYPFATHAVSPQNPHPTDPNNQYPHPLTGSMTEPGPALAGGYNVYDPHNVIGAPPAFSERDRALEHNKAVMQSQSPYAPYIMNQVPVPPQ
ncbi:EsV-1-89 [Ectocarpus siliculosus]|uniref:EsV-1-89 n=1 Tax=Ectocarpus siliculosus TaxID=2880 RepID=D8LPC0_ECTSI|nr:EsV-1-89 [Ectocarpus siliculosus]|eukprot:CBN80391.1 EsV-1-89 [Ectocarpus siliculosus]